MLQKYEHGMHKQCQIHFCNLSLSTYLKRKGKAMIIPTFSRTVINLAFLIHLWPFTSTTISSNQSYDQSSDIKIKVQERTKALEINKASYK